VKAFENIREFGQPTVSAQLLLEKAKAGRSPLEQRIFSLEQKDVQLCDALANLQATIQQNKQELSMAYLKLEYLREYTKGLVFLAKRERQAMDDLYSAYIAKVEALDNAALEQHSVEGDAESNSN
jgi:hypothetical protein